MSLNSYFENHRIFQQFARYIPTDNARQAGTELLVAEILKSRTVERVLDLGCGEGNSVELFRKISPAAAWCGVDIEDSPEVRARRRSDGNFSSFDGVNLPYDENYFDVIYSRQVYEHVRYPDALTREAFRVLKDGGVFVGSVSYLEPYHSFSVFNFTPYGIISVFSEAGFVVEELRPGIDAFTMITRQIFNKPSFFNFFFRWSPFHMLIDVVGFCVRMTPQHRNFLKMQFSGQLCFIARKEKKG